jgi:hypothetical protein
MAFVHFDSGYAPCGFLIVRKDDNPYKESDTVLVQSDWDYPGIASDMGLRPCDCGETDGTIDCAHKTATDMIGAAFDHILAHEGEEFEALDVYFD